MPSMPNPVRAAIGLVAVTAEGIRHIPARISALPVSAASHALQLSQVAHQEYLDLIDRGNNVLHRTKPSVESVPFNTDLLPDADEEDEAYGANVIPVRTTREPSKFDAAGDE